MTLDLSASFTRSWLDQALCYSIPLVQLVKAHYVLIVIRQKMLVVIYSLLLNTDFATHAHTATDYIRLWASFTR